MALANSEHGQKRDPPAKEFLSGTSEIFFDDPRRGDRQREKPTKLRRLFEYLRALKEAGFTGYIKINYSQGHIGRVEKFEEVLKEQE